MTIDVFTTLGAAWSWALVGMVLAISEAFVPGVFLIWFGLAAFATALVVAGIGLDWPIPLLVFAGFAVAAAWIGSRLTRHDRSHLNRRGHDLVGRTFVLDAPVTGGVGRWRQDDTSWRLTGPELPAGASVRIVRLDGATLVVEAA